MSTLFTNGHSNTDMQKNSTEEPDFHAINWVKYDAKYPIDSFEFFGPKNPYFKMVHCTALACTAVSITFSLSTIIYQVRTNNGNFFTWKIGRRWRKIQHTTVTEF